MSHFIKLSEIKLKEEEMGHALGGNIPAVIGVSVIEEPPVVCYGVPDPPYIKDITVSNDLPR